MNINILEIVKGGIVEILGGVIVGFFAYFIARRQLNKEKQNTVSIEAKFIIANMKLDFFENGLQWLSNHEQALYRSYCLPRDE